MFSQIASKSRNVYFGTFLQPERRPQPSVDKKKRWVGGVFAAFQAHWRQKRKAGGRNDNRWENRGAAKRAGHEPEGRAFIQLPGKFIHHRKRLLFSVPAHKAPPSGELAKPSGFDWEGLGSAAKRCIYPMGSLLVKMCLDRPCGCATIKAPARLLSRRAVCVSRWKGFALTSVGDATNTKI